GTVVAVPDIGQEPPGRFQPVTAVGRQVGRATSHRPDSVYDRHSLHLCWSEGGSPNPITLKADDGDCHATDSTDDTRPAVGRELPACYAGGRSYGASPE